MKMKHTRITSIDDNANTVCSSISPKILNHVDEYDGIIQNTYEEFKEMKRRLFERERIEKIDVKLLRLNLIALKKVINGLLWTLWRYY